ncbi:hypothetical protein AB0H60_19435 [Nocardia rhamnosiphila]|uniref:hypothetical protein n=1 Tax=Nocardia rhamnosiphila TaxID=426716 RepID=UPI0033D4D10F
MKTQSIATPSVETVRQIVSLGGETEERRAGREAIAESHIEMTLATDEAVAVCLAELEESDRRLAESIKNGPKPSPGPYDWQVVTFEANEAGGGTVRFGVAWYNENFFQEKKDIYLDSNHGALFGKFGVEPSDVKVTHWIETS